MCREKLNLILTHTQYHLQLIPSLYRTFVKYQISDKSDKTLLLRSLVQSRRHCSAASNHILRLQRHDERQQLTT